MPRLNSVRAFHLTDTSYVHSKFKNPLFHLPNNTLNIKLWTGCRFPQTITIPLAVTQLYATDCLHTMKYFKCFERFELCTAISLHRGRTSTSDIQCLFRVPEVSIWNLALRCIYKNLHTRKQRCSEAQ